jgi:hypothetical protein
MQIHGGQRGIRFSASVFGFHYYSVPIYHRLDTSVKPIITASDFNLEAKWCVAGLFPFRDRKLILLISQLWNTTAQST